MSTPMPTAGPGVPRALLISADVQVITEVQQAVQRLGILVDLCSVANRIPSKLERSKFEAIIVDYDIGVDASTITQWIRQSPANQNCVRLTLLGTVGTDRLTTQQGTSNFLLHKPISSAELTKILQSALGVMVRERRRYFRCGVRVPVWLETDVARPSCIALNISEGGIAIQSPSQFQYRDRLHIRFTLPGNKDEIKAVCEVNWLGERGRAGLRFVELTSQSRWELQRWLSGELERQSPLAAAVVAAAR